MKIQKFVLPLVACLLVACGGGGGGGSSLPGGGAPAPTPTPTATPALGATSSAIATLTALGETVALPTITGGAAASFAVPPATAGAGSQLSVTLSGTNPPGVPVLAASNRQPSNTFRFVSRTGRTVQTINGSAVDYMTFSVAPSNATLSGNATISFTLPANTPTTGVQFLIAAYDPVNLWQPIAGSATAASNGVVTYRLTTTGLTLVTGQTYAFAIYTSNAPVPTPTPPGTLSAVNAACLPFGGVSGMSVGRRAQSSQFLPRRMPGRAGSLKYQPGLLAVIYKSGSRSAQASVPGARAIKAFANGLSSETHVLAIADDRIDGAIAQLKNDPNVLSASRVAVRYLTSAPANFTNDPYFSENPSPPPSGFTKPPAPCLESATNPGQWDMHQIGLEDAFGYASAANSLGVANAGAMGNATVKIAMIDTGADVTHPDLSGAKVVYKKCIITQAPAGTTGCNASDATDVTDYDGHGTNTAGIAAASINNGFGFVGVGGNASLMIYRIFPSGAQSSANTADEAAALSDAVANGANVISLSLGSPGSGDPTEQAAINAAISAGVTVVAASGNGTAATVDYPGAYPGVIAVGATAVNDSNPAAPFEYVASYSNYDAANSAWGIVAPGGDPSGNTDNDFLHWVEGLYSNAAPAPQQCSAFLGRSDFFGETGNCNALFAGTSQATPHVAGAVALLLSVHPGMTPAQVAAALQASAHNIGDAKQGYGRLNVYRLIGTALGDANLPAQ